jgi:dCMP deaminase
MKRLSWDEYFGLLVQVIALRSDDEETKVGSVIVDKRNRVISTGYNGTPMGTSLPKTRPDKYPVMSHSEENSILFSKCDLTNCKIYILGMLPCSTCARMIIQSGINEVIIVNEKERVKGNDWNFDITKTMFTQVSITIRCISVPLINIL